MNIEDVVSLVLEQDNIYLRDKYPELFYKVEKIKSQPLWLPHQDQISMCKSCGESFLKKGKENYCSITCYARYYWRRNYSKEARL